MTVADKASVRAAAVAARESAFGMPGRAARVSAACGAVFDALATIGLTQAILAGYMPMRSEIDPLPTMTGHAGPVCVPIIQSRGQALTFRQWTADTPLIAGLFGEKVPASGAPLRPRVLIVPLLAFDARGHRLGYGGGFYDRTLAGLRAEGPVLAIGLAFAAQARDNVPTEPTDEPLDAVATENGIKWFGA